MHWIDWLLIAIPFVVVCMIAVVTRRFIHGVSDFLAAGRVAGRYLVANAESTADVGAIAIVAMFEMFYKAGTTVGWWQSLKMPLWLLMAGSGYIIYRYRETRAMTMAQFLEMRYTRRFRIFMGIMAWISGLLNFGIAPVVTSKFFVIFLSLPLYVHPMGAITIPTYVIIMGSMITANLIFATLGGQLSTMVADCVEGLISGVLFIVLMIGVCCVFSWHQMSIGLTSEPPAHSLINPFDAAKIPDFTFFWVLTWLATGMYGYMSWQGKSAFNASAFSPHEAKMGKLLGQWRTFARNCSLTLLAFGALTYMHNPGFLAGAAKVSAEAASVSRQLPENQSVVPLALRSFLPLGMKGMLGAIMLFAAMACDTSYMHSWGSIFVQDVLLPIRQIMNRPALSPEDHLRWLRRSIIGVGVFAFVFGILWTQDEYILNFFAVTAAIFLGGAGSCIVGGLYWKRGTTAGAWAGMIVGSSLAVSGMVAKQIFAGFPINGQYVFTIAMVSSIATYTLVSLATCRKPHDMDKLLHRGRYAVDPVTGEPLNIIRRPDSTWRGIIGIDDESSTIDKFQCLILFSWGAAWTIAFAVVTLWNLFWKWPTSWWVNWTLWTSVILAFVISTGTTIWFTFGGVRDLRRLFVRLRKVVVNDLDDGRVADGASEGRETPGARGELELAQQPLSSPRAKG